VLRAAGDAGLRQLTGKVHARNLGMRALYRKFGFQAAHVTMEKRLAGQGGQGGEGGKGWEGGQGGEGGKGWEGGSQTVGGQDGPGGGKEIRP
jgi:hypothetical protein